MFLGYNANNPIGATMDQYPISKPTPNAITRETAGLSFMIPEVSCTVSRVRLACCAIGGSRSC